MDEVDPQDIEKQKLVEQIGEVFDVPLSMLGSSDDEYEEEED